MRTNPRKAVEVIDKQPHLAAMLCDQLTRQPPADANITEIINDGAEHHHRQGRAQAPQQQIQTILNSAQMIRLSQYGAQYNTGKFQAERQTHQTQD